MSTVDLWTVTIYNLSTMNMVYQRNYIFLLWIDDISQSGSSSIIYVISLFFHSFNGVPMRRTCLSRLSSRWLMFRSCCWSGEKLHYSFSPVSEEWLETILYLFPFYFSHSFIISHFITSLSVVTHCYYYG